jgi:DNA repair protein RadA
MQTALYAAKTGARTLYVDTEGSFRPERLEQLAKARGWDAGGLMEKIMYVRCDSAPEQMETIRQMQERSATAPSKVVVVDTLTRNFSVELPGASNIPNRQAAIDIHLSEIARDAYLNGRAYVLTNRVTFGPTRDVGIGGRTVEQMVNMSLMMEKEGTRVKATVIGTGAFVQLEISGSGIE